jgi:hypothetical protein
VVGSMLALLGCSSSHIPPLLLSSLRCLAHSPPSPLEYPDAHGTHPSPPFHPHSPAPHVRHTHVFHTIHRWLRPPGPSNAGTRGSAASRVSIPATCHPSSRIWLRPGCPTPGPCSRHAPSRHGGECIHWLATG